MRGAFEGIIHITYADCDLVIPNVITPGDDNLNKRFKVTNLNQFPNSTIQIFNRWGQEVFGRRLRKHERMVA